MTSTHPSTHADRRELLVRVASLAAATLMAPLSLLPAMAAGSQSEPTPTTRTQPMYAYVGSRTTRERNAHGDGISVFKVDSESGSLELVQLVTDLINPSFLAFSRGGEFLYTVHGDASDASAFKVDKASGRLAFINKQTTQGQNPVHLAIDPTGRHLVVSNHIGSSLAVLPIDADGSLGKLTQLVPLSGPLGPHRVEQKQSKPHFNPFDPSGRFVVVPDKGLDRIFVFRFKDGELVPGATPFTVTREGAGPRHLAFHPTLDMLYVVNELDSTVTTYRFEPRSGQLEAVQILSSLPETFTGNSRASEIEIARSGRFLYASNRGHDSIATFQVDATTGLLAFKGADPTLGRTPRFFALAPDGGHLFALNEESDSIVTMKVDAASGRLTPTGLPVASGSPVCMVFSA